jgi:hypothetical protein
MNNTHEVIRHIYFLLTYKWMILTTITLRSFTKSVRMMIQFGQRIELNWTITMI